MFAYCGNNPVSRLDQTGKWAQWLVDAWEAIKDFFSPETGSYSVYESGGTDASCQVLLTAGYSEFSLSGMGQGQQANKKRNEYEHDAFAGVSGSISLLNASTTIGSSQGENLKGNGAITVDVLSLSGYAGYQYKNGLGVGAGAFASALSYSFTGEFEIFGWEVVFGATGDCAAIGAEARCGFTNGVMGMNARCALGFGIGFFLEIGVPDCLIFG
jgi:hypothetical protein